VAYEIFERSVIRVEQPVVTILSDGRLTLNAAATRILEKAGVRTVRILWDKLNCGIALQASERGDKNSYSIAFSRGRSASVSLKAFLTSIGWSANRRQSVPAKWDSSRRMLEAELPARYVGGRSQKEARRKTEGDL
jgi:hypothetical protein